MIYERCSTTTLFLLQHYFKKLYQSVEILFRVSEFIMSEEEKKTAETCRYNFAEIYVF